MLDHFFYALSIYSILFTFVLILTTRLWAPWGEGPHITHVIYSMTKNILDSGAESKFVFLTVSDYPLPSENYQRNHRVN